MLRRRIAYGLLLVCAVLFQICFTGYLSFFVLILAVCFPLLSLAVSLPGILGCCLTLNSRFPDGPRGTAGQWEIHIHNKAGFPLSRLRFILRTENRLTGERVTTPFSLSGVSSKTVTRGAVEAGHCGRLDGALLRPRACDLLGLFSLPVPAPPKAFFYAMPIASTDQEAPIPSGDQDAGGNLRPRPGGGPGEDYDLRPYRLGDPMRSVHWKLSTKLDDLVVRETLEPQQTALILTFDHFGPPSRMDAVLDRLCAASHALISSGRAHYIQWADAESGHTYSFPVSTQAELDRCLHEALGQLAPLTGKSILDTQLRAPGGDRPARHLHITAPDVGEGGPV